MTHALSYWNTTSVSLVITFSKHRLLAGTWSSWERSTKSGNPPKCLGLSIDVMKYTDETGVIFIYGRYETGFTRLQFVP